MPSLTAVAIISLALLIAAAGIAYFVWSTTPRRRSASGKNLNKLSDEELLEAFIDSAQDCVAFIQSKKSEEKQEALHSYQRVLDVRTEVVRRDPLGKILIPLLHDEDDAVRVPSLCSCVSGQSCWGQIF